MPDYYVPLDTTVYTKLHRELSAKSCVNGTVLKFMDKNRNSLEKKYKKKDVEFFRDNFVVDESMFDILKAEAEKAGVKYTEEEFNESKPMLSKVLKALVGRDLWETSAYYELFNDNNNIYAKGLEVIQTDEPKTITRWMK